MAQANQAVGVLAAEAMKAARGKSEDGAWTYPAVMRFATKDVSETVIQREMTEASRLVEYSGESPQELFGDPRRWADDKIEIWREEQADVFEPFRTTLRSGVQTVLWTASALALMMVISLLIFGRWTVRYTPGYVTMPLVLSLIIAVMIAVYTRVNAARGHVASIVVTAVTLTAMSALAGFYFQGIEWTGHRGSFLWTLLMVAGYAAVAWVVARVWRGKSPEHSVTGTEDLSSAPADDDGWIRAARRVMNERGDLTEKTIDRHLTEAQTHVRESGQSLEQEFGTAEGYARSVSGDPVVPLRRRMVLTAVVLAGICCLALMTLQERGFGWSDGAVVYLLWALSTAVTLWTLFARIRALRRQGGSPS